jgi:hypothetical protein
LFALIQSGVMALAGVITFAGLATILGMSEIWDILQVLLRRKKAAKAIEEAAA